MIGGVNPFIVVMQRWKISKSNEAMNANIRVRTWWIA
jgi:hypothetical protein